MSEHLTEIELAELRYLAQQPGLIWGGVYDRGGAADICRWERLGLVEGVARPYTAGKSKFSGGYRITRRGRIRIAEPSPPPQVQERREG